jgi:hypothetical protein
MSTADPEINRRWEEGRAEAIRPESILTAALINRLCDVAVELGLRRITASTDTHTVTVSEPSMWAVPRTCKPPRYGFDIEVRERDL